MTPRRIGWFLSLQDVLLTTTAHIATSYNKQSPPRHQKPWKNHWKIVKSQIEQLDDTPIPTRNHKQSHFVLNTFNPVKSGDVTTDSLLESPKITESRMLMTMPKDTKSRYSSSRKEGGKTYSKARFGWSMVIGWSESHSTWIQDRDWTVWCHSNSHGQP
jgi:hypothetical protein